jgi:hypothetical protein
MSNQRVVVATLAVAAGITIRSPLGAQRPTPAPTHTDAAHNVTFVTGPVRLLGLPAVADPDLEPGFPVQGYANAGTYHGGPAIHTLVGNIDADPRAEILMTSLAGGQLYAWHWDGSPVAGWPVAHSGPAYPALGRLTTACPGLFSVFAGYMFQQPELAAYDGTGAALPGWPKNGANYTATPPGLGDVNHDQLDEIFVEEEDWHLHAYEAGGGVLSGWPANEFQGDQERHTPAIADLDGDGSPEIVSASGLVSPGGVYVFANHANGTALSGFPVTVSGYVDTFPVIGDVDGDGHPEIVVLSAQGLYLKVNILAANGTVKRTMLSSAGVPYGSAPALADLDGDAIPEIIVQSDGQLDVWKGDGTVFPGWPQNVGPYAWMGNSAPVVGDVDGDGQPDIAITIQQAGSGVNGEVRLYSRYGVLHSSFPKPLPIGSGAVPAIADVDGDGRNELVVGGSAWTGSPGLYDQVWMYDLHGPGPYGRIEWGQFNGGPQHNGRYSGFNITGPPILTTRRAFPICSGVLR